MPTPLSQRLKEVRKALGLSATEMAERVGLGDRKSWENYERGGTSPKADVLSHLAEMGIDTNWLLTGAGQMLKGAILVPGNHDLNRAIDEELLARIGEEVAELYRQENARLNQRQLARLQARLYGDLVAAYDDQAERLVGLKGMIQQLRRDLRAPAPGADTSKRLA